MDAPATVKFRCTSCRQKLRVRAELIGHRVKCPRCGCSLAVPAEGLPDDGPKAHPHPPVPPQGAVVPPVAPPPRPPGPPPVVLEPRPEPPRMAPPVSAARPPAPPPPAPDEPQDLLPVLEPCSEPEDPLPVLEVLSEVEPAARPPLPNAPPPPLRGG